MPTSYLDDHAPVGVADKVTLTAQQASLVTESIFTYTDSDGVLQTVVTDVFGSTIDVLANDTDPDAIDQGHLAIFDFTQPVDAQGHAVGSLAVEKDANGHDVLRFYDATPDDTSAQTLTFSYRVADEWADDSKAATDPRNVNSVSAPTTVSITIGGNAVPGETMTGGNHPQSLQGGAGNDYLAGGNDKDTVNGGAGADTLHGNNGVDSVNGGSGNDRLFGDNGDDTLNGGYGDDTMTGGNGADRFVFDYVNGVGFGHDVITDFDTKNDRLVVDHNFWGSFGDVQAHAVQVGANVVLTSDFDGNTLTLQGVKLASLTASDFIFV